MQPGPDGPELQGQTFGDLLIGKTFHIAQYENHPLLFRQSADGLFQQSLELLAFEKTVRIRGGIATKRLQVIDNFREPALARLFLFMVQATVGRNAIKPGGKKRLTVEIPERVLNLDENVLGQIFGFGPIAEHPGGDPQHPAPVLQNQLIE
ncbi:MAG TPA: hypothetical protein VGL70_01115 [Candidatus Binatia bacterium]